MAMWWAAFLRLASAALMLCAISACDPIRDVATSSQDDAADEGDGAPRDDEEDAIPEGLMLVIGLDLSKSNPLVESDSYAESVADLVADQIEDLPMASEVMLRTFGEYDATQNNLRVDRRVTANDRPEDLAVLLSEIVAGVPQLVREGTLEAQDMTNIVPFLENVSQFVDCKEMDTIVMLVSDGIEDSEYASLTDPGQSLPKPGRIFRGCRELWIVGLGQGLDSPTATDRLRDEWKAWSKAAGFKDFYGLNDW